MPSAGANAKTVSSVVDCVTERGICVLEGALDKQAVRACQGVGMARFANCDAVRRGLRSPKLGNVYEKDSPGYMCGDFFQSTLGRWGLSFLCQFSDPRYSF